MFKYPERKTVIPVQAIGRARPKKSITILQETGHRIVTQAVIDSEVFNMERRFCYGSRIGLRLDLVCLHEQGRTNENYRICKEILHGYKLERQGYTKYRFSCIKLLSIREYTPPGTRREGGSVFERLLQACINALYLLRYCTGDNPVIFLNVVLKAFVSV